ncbi:Peptidase propeptide and YPEB domain [Anaerococcus octavius]|uniref:Peptidase propeptide and YPEB domain n=1 Tax=Anaerococcus octavius TaxID=54007 RepID=A0A380WVU5_9FIRM|nr:PepSY domain-containing protein [Anaerococcus octavius]SUU92943.1 Peptidase propeptide and YPEB domain [Anaerococcus octavius]
MKFKNLKYGASALVLATVLTACGGENAQKAKDNAKDAKNNTEAAVTEEAEKTKDNVEDKKDDVEDKIDDLKTGIEEKEFDISLDDAVDKFKETFPSEGVEVSSVELDEDDDNYVYDIQGFDENKEYEAKIDAESGEVLAQEEETDEEVKDNVAIDFVSIISPKEAMDKALENNEGYVKSYEIESNDEGKLVYKINVEDGDDVELDAESGDILHK